MVSQNTKNHYFQQFTYSIPAFSYTIQQNFIIYTDNAAHIKQPTSYKQLRTFVGNFSPTVTVTLEKMVVMVKLVVTVKPAVTAPLVMMALHRKLTGMVKVLVKLQIRRVLEICRNQLPGNVSLFL